MVDAIMGAIRQGGLFNIDDFKDGKIIGTKRLYADGKFGKDGKAKFMATPMARARSAGQTAGEGEVSVPRQQRASQPRLAVDLSRSI